MASKTDEILDKLREEIVVSEGYLVALLWNNPSLFDVYTDEELNKKSFANNIYGFYFSLGNYMFEKGISLFDDITASRFVQELKIEEKYDRYGGYQTIEDIIIEVKDKEDNFEGYYEDVKKYELIRNLYNLFGTKVIKNPENKKYDYKKMTREQLENYWLDKVNQLVMTTVGYEEESLLKGLDGLVDDLDQNPDEGMPLYGSKRLNEAIGGWADGCLYIFGGFGGKGKTSFVFNKVIMSCLINKEKLLIIANEQSVRDFQKMLLVTIMGNETKRGFNRQRLNEGNFTDEERLKLEEAVEKIKEITDGDDSLIKFAFLDSYTMSNVKKIVTRNYRRGYKSLIIDTGKPADDKGSMQRWERFTEDFKELYKIIKPNGGLNIKTWINVQLADSAISQRFLDETALGDSKKIKNEASVVLMGRPAWDNELIDGNKELIGYSWIRRELAEQEDEFNELESDVTYEDVNPDSPYVKKIIPLSPTTKTKDGKTYYNKYFLVFVPKNRRGRDNSQGLDVLVYKQDLNRNVWYEHCWVTVPRDYSY